MLRKILITVYNFFPNWVAEKVRYRIEFILRRLWFVSNPWHSLKQKIIKNLQKNTWIKIFVETWTYEWAMLDAQLNNFDRLYSVELSNFYYKRAINKFSKNKKIKLILWDSWVEIWKILRELNDRAIFFLDWHFSWWKTAKWDLECPLKKELEAFKSININNHIIIVDDVRLCWKDKDYPTVSELKSQLLSINSKYKIQIKDDQLIAYV